MRTNHWSWTRPNRDYLQRFTGILRDITRRMEARRFARELGAFWAGDSTSLPPEELDAAILYAPVGALVPTALRAVAKGGTVVCAGIHMSDKPSFPYRLLWSERTVRSRSLILRSIRSAACKPLLSFWQRRLGEYARHQLPRVRLAAARALRAWQELAAEHSALTLPGSLQDAIALLAQDARASVRSSFHSAGERA